MCEAVASTVCQDLGCCVDMYFVSTYYVPHPDLLCEHLLCVEKNGLLCGRQLCEHLLCAPALGCCVSTYCVSGIGLLWEQRMRAKL